MYILSVPLPDDDIVDEMSVLRARMHPRRPGYVTGGEAEDRVCHQQVTPWRSSRPLLLQLPTPCFPMTHSQAALTQPTLALSSRMMNLSALGTVEMTAFKSSSLISSGLVMAGHTEALTRVANFFPCQRGSLIVISRSFAPFGGPASLPTSVALTN